MGTYQKRLPTFEELEHWFLPAPTANVGIVTGMVSGIFVLDCDSGGDRLGRRTSAAVWDAG